MTQEHLARLAWPARLNAALTTDTGRPARIASVARDRLHALAESGALQLTLPGHEATGAFAVGDWVLYDPATLRVTERLDRKTLLRRKSAGRDSGGQLIAANVDTLGIVSACNADFNVARLERYLALAANAGCLPLVILTRADECQTPEALTRQAEALSPLVAAIALDARDPSELRRLWPWCGPGETLALVGSSGVGKTTLANGLTGRSDQTGAIREDDAKGRHTTTARMLRPTLAGGWLADTPGMRELGLTDAQDGIGAVFSDLDALAAACRFSDCQHESEPGCAVQEAIADGRVDPDRLTRWRKLLREDAYNSENAAERRSRGRAREKLYAEGRAQGRRKRGGR